MLKKDIIEEQQEQLRRQVRELPDSVRARYYNLSEKSLKDPDTYATLNYIFIAGLHHFYLGKWALGLMNILVFWGGVACVYFGAIEAGIALIIGIFVFELYELFRSETIVMDHNNNSGREILATLVTSPELNASKNTV
jgi:TM2 domain-containing membrane protein YozV